MNSYPNDLIKPWIRTILILPAFIFITGFFQFLCYLFLGLNITPSNIIPKTSIQMLVIMFGTLVGTTITVTLFRFNIDKESFKSLGFYKEGFFRNTCVGLIIGAAIMTLGFLTMLYTNQISFEKFNLNWKELFLGIGVFLCVSISEELLIRGYVLNNLMKSFSILPSLVISSIMFSLGHVFNPHFSFIGLVNLILAGILLGTPYIFTQNLSIPFALHFSWNFFQGTIFGFNVSGKTIYSIISFSCPQETIWNGGKFGFEGSIICMFLQVMAIVGLAWYFQNAEQKKRDC